MQTALAASASYSAPMTMSAQDQELAAAAHEPRQESTASTRETTVLWEAGEGQVVNALAYLIAVLFCWLVLPLGWALWRFLATARHRYTLTNARLLEESGVLVKRLEAVELYRVKDISVSGTMLQRLFGRGQVIVVSTDATTPTMVLNAVPDPIAISQLIRDAVESCRSARGVRAFDF